ncbi:MAG: ABC transporter substrate-binding protein, partial [Clostridiales bacterium]|nr:ABC transporter substrate-binding protein [Clostridiales bacterium]
IYPIAGDISTLDPQSASTSDELMIIENTMEGLLRFDADGELSGGIAERWEVSDDGLTYTFYLRDNAKWDLNSNILELMEDETWDPYVTAHDFVFALQRAAMPNTQAPYFIRIASIENAWAVHDGSADASALGVSAADDFTLEIKLSETDEHFLETMAMAIAMPCNEEFFYATKGR